MAHQAYISAPTGGFWSNWQSMGMVTGPITLALSWRIESGDVDANVAVRYFNEDNEEVEEVLTYNGQMIRIGESIFDLKAKARSISLQTLGVLVTAN